MVTLYEQLVDENPILEQPVLFLRGASAGVGVFLAQQAICAEHSKLLHTLQLVKSHFDRETLPVFMIHIVKYAQFWGAT